MDPNSPSGFGPGSSASAGDAGNEGGATSVFEFADFGQLTLDPFTTAQQSQAAPARPGMHRIPTHHSSYDDADSEHHAQVIDKAAQQPRTSSSDRPGSSSSFSRPQPTPASPAPAPIDYGYSTFSKRLSSGRMAHGRYSSMSSIRSAAAQQERGQDDTSPGNTRAGPLPRPPTLFGDATPSSPPEHMPSSSSVGQTNLFRPDSRLSAAEPQQRPTGEDLQDNDRNLVTGRPTDGNGRSTPSGSRVVSAADAYENGSQFARPASRSSLFGAESINGTGGTGAASGPVASLSQQPTSQAERIAAYHRSGISGAASAGAPAGPPPSSFRQSSASLLAQGVTAPASQVPSPTATSPTGAGQTNHGSHGSTGIGSIGSGGMGGLGASGSTRPPSIAPTVTSSYGGTAGSIYGAGMLLDHRHLQPGKQAALLSHEKTLELYRHNAKKTNDPNLIYEFAVFMIDAAKSMAAGEGDDAASKSPNPATVNGSLSAGGLPTSRSASPVANGAREELVKEAIGLLKRIADRGHADAQYFLGDCYANGIGTPKGKHDFDRAYPLFVLAAKHGHPDAAYRAGTCYEKGWGCRKDAGKALQFYKKAASPGDAGGHPGAMYRLATAELNGELGCKKSAKEGVKWLKRSAEAATPEFPHALHELALLHERGIDNVLFVDPEYSCELLAQAAELGYAPSAYKLGVNYEYGRMGCPQDAGLSIHMYNIAAQQAHKEACFALTAWYLVGAPGILPQSDTEAYLWAKKAGEQGLSKAEYAVGYFTEMGIGTVKDLAEAKAWYRRAQEHGDKRANQRLAALGSSNGVGLGFGNRAGGRKGQTAPPPPTKVGTPAQGSINASQQGERQRVLREQQDAEDARLAGLREDARNQKEAQRTRSQQAKNKRQFDFVAPPTDMRVSQYGMPDAESRARQAAMAAAANNRMSVAPSERPMSQAPSTLTDFNSARFSQQMLNGPGGMMTAPITASPQMGGGGYGPRPGGGPPLPMSPPPGMLPGQQKRPSLPPGAGQGNLYGRQGSLPPPGAASAYPTYQPGQSILKQSSSPPNPNQGPFRGGPPAGIDTTMGAVGPGRRYSNGPQSAGPGGAPPGMSGYRSPTNGQNGPYPPLSPGLMNGGGGGPLPGATLPPPGAPVGAGDGKRKNGWFK